MADFWPKSQGVAEFPTSQNFMRVTYANVENTVHLLTSLSIISSVTEILVHQKFWSGGPNFLENWSAGPLFSENFGPRVELWSERKYFGVSTLTTHVCVKVSV